MTRSEHLPERFYSECQFHTEPDQEDFLTDDLEIFYKAVDDFWDEHFYTSGDDSLLSCEDSYMGLCCTACTDDNDGWIVIWPCDQAVINDYIIEQALQSSQNPLKSWADSLA